MEEEEIINKAICGLLDKHEGFVTGYIQAVASGWNLEISSYAADGDTRLTDDLLVMVGGTNDDIGWCAHLKQLLTAHVEFELEDGDEENIQQAISRLRAIAAHITALADQAESELRE